MSRFEEEISKPISRNENVSFQNLNYQRQNTPFQFIPHSIQRQLPSSAKSTLNKSASTSSCLLQSTQNNVEKPHYKAMPITNLTNSTSSINYTVTPLGLPPGVTRSLTSNNFGSNSIYSNQSGANDGPTSASTSTSNTMNSSITATTTNTTITTTTSKKHSKNGESSNSKNKKILRLAGGQVWEDSSLLEWNLDDFRLFCGDLGNDVSDDVLSRGFSKYPSFLKAKVIRDKRTNKSKGYGFVSFKDPQDYMRAMKEMDGKYLGSRPIKLRKSTWKDRSLEMVRKKQREKSKFKFL